MPLHYMTPIFFWNSRLVILVGFPLNALLFWLILVKTPKEMRVHSRILLQTCVVDIILLILNSISSTNAMMVPNSATKIIFFDGYLLQISLAIFGNNRIFLILLGFAILTVFFFDVFGIPAQFVYRYLVLNRNVNFNIARYILILTFPILTSFILALLFCIIGTEGSMELDENVQALLSDYIDLQDSVYISLISNQLNIKMFFTIYCLSMIICYIVNIFCGIKMIEFVQSHADFNPRMKELNRQLTKSLIILAIFPLAFCCCSLLYTSFYYFANADLSLQADFFYSMMSTWITSINPLVTVWINRPYRDAIRKIFLKKNVVSTIHPNSAPQ